MRKGEIAHYEQFLLFPQCFQKACFSKGVIVWEWVIAVLQYYFSYIAAASAPIHTFLEFLLPKIHKIFFPSHWLLSYMAIIKTMVWSERRMNPVAITLVNPWKEIGQASYQRPWSLLTGLALQHRLPESNLTHSHTMTPFDGPGKEAF